MKITKLDRRFRLKRWELATHSIKIIMDQNGPAYCHKLKKVMTLAYGPGYNIYSFHTSIDLMNSNAKWYIEYKIISKNHYYIIYLTDDSQSTYLSLAMT